MTTPGQEQRFRELASKHTAVARRQIGDYLLLEARDVGLAVVELVAVDGKPLPPARARDVLAGARASDARHLDRIEEALIGLLFLHRDHGAIAAVAERSGIPRQTLYNRLAKLEAPAA